MSEIITPSPKLKQSASMRHQLRQSRQALLSFLLSPTCILFSEALDLQISNSELSLLLAAGPGGIGAQPTVRLLEVLNEHKFHFLNVAQLLVVLRGLKAAFVDFGASNSEWSNNDNNQNSQGPQRRRPITWARSPRGDVRPKDHDRLKLIRS